MLLQLYLPVDTTLQCSCYLSQSSVCIADPLPSVLKQTTYLDMELPCRNARHPAYADHLHCMANTAKEVILVEDPAAALLLEIMEGSILSRTAIRQGLGCGTCILDQVCALCDLVLHAISLLSTGLRLHLGQLVCKFNCHCLCS